MCWCDVDVIALIWMWSSCYNAVNDTINMILICGCWWWWWCWCWWWWYDCICRRKCFWGRTWPLTWVLLNPGFGVYVIWNARICNKNIMIKCQYRGFRGQKIHVHGLGTFFKFCFFHHVYGYMMWMVWRWCDVCVPVAWCWPVRRMSPCPPLQQGL